MSTSTRSKTFLDVALPLGGVVLFFAVGAFFGNIWGAVLSSMIPVGLYMCYLGSRIIRQATSSAEKGLSLGVLLVLVALITTNGYGALQRSEWKRHMLIDIIREGVDWGYMTETANIHLLKTLAAYHNRLPGSGNSSAEETGKKKIGALFEKRYADRLRQREGVTEFDPPVSEDPPLAERDYPVIYYDSTGPGNAEPDDSGVALIGQSAAGNGQDPTFTGYDGREGHVQYRFTLTREGLTYDREN